VDGMNEFGHPETLKSTELAQAFREGPANRQ